MTCLKFVIKYTCLISVISHPHEFKSIMTPYLSEFIESLFVNSFKDVNKNIFFYLLLLDSQVIHEFVLAFYVFMFLSLGGQGVSVVLFSLYFSLECLVPKVIFRA